MNNEKKKVMRILWNYNENKFGLPNEVPDELLSENRAQQNHGQTLKRLNERGGMAVDEVVCNFLDVGLHVKECLSLELCAKYLHKRLDYYNKNHEKRN